LPLAPTMLYTMSYTTWYIMHYDIVHDIIKTYDIVGFDQRYRTFWAVIANRTYDVTYDIVYDVVGFLRCRIRYA
jgi:hypothetical protein